MSKFTVITSAAFGAGYCGMCGPGRDPRMIQTWSHAQMGVMGPDQATNILADVKTAQLRRKGHAPDEAAHTPIADPHHGIFRL